MILYPKIYLHDVTKITSEMLRTNGIKALILDMDNTLLDMDKNIIEGGQEWIKSMKMLISISSPMAMKSIIAKNLAHLAVSSRYNLPCWLTTSCCEFSFSIRF